LLNQNFKKPSEVVGNINLSPQQQTNNLKEYLNVFRANLLPIILIFLSSVLITVLYVINAMDIYKTTTTLKIVRPQGSILTAQLVPEIQDFQADRYISNEIEIMKSYNMRERVVSKLLDSVKVNPDKEKFYYVINKKKNDTDNRSEISSNLELNKILEKIISINQKRGLDIIEIEVQSPSNYEAQLIADLYAQTYMNYSIDYSRRELINIKNFLEEEKSKKITDLNNSEIALQEYQQKGGVIFLDDKAKKLVDQISTFEAEKNASEIEYKSKQKAYSEIEQELIKIDKSISDYIEGQLGQPYMQELQKKIAEVQIQKEIDVSIPSDTKLKEKVSNEYDKKLAPLKKSYDEKINIIKTGLVANTPQEKSVVYQKFLEVNIDVQSYKARLNLLNNILSKYENEFKKLPAQSIELARLERERKSDEKLYLTLEEKYQEAIINERAELGNANIIDKALLPTKPSKPNRSLIVSIGSILGIMLGIGFAFLRNYLDRSIKTPEEIESKGIPVLSWVPSIEELKELGSSQLEFIVVNKPNATASESFKALRTRVMYSKIESELKTILVTSSIPSEGKTTVALNLAGSFAQTEKKVLLLDADLRKPRIHAVFESERFPGLSDYLFSNVTLNEIIRDTKLKNLNFITSGTIPPNPSELLGSKQMSDFIDKLRGIYDVIIIDSPPFISVTDSEILSRTSDGTIMIVQANKTPMDTFLKTYNRIININPHKFLGSVLNNFSLKSAYGYYYNYYYYYSRPGEEDKRRSKQIKKS
jgi:capsular exopolysaccharide synthesis family protein